MFNLFSKWDTYNEFSGWHTHTQRTAERDVDDNDDRDNASYGETPEIASPLYVRVGEQL